MRFLHTMVRVADLDASLKFYCDLLGLTEVRRMENEPGRFTLIFLAAPADAERSAAERSPELELTFNWDPATYDGGRNFGHLAYKVAARRYFDRTAAGRPGPGPGRALVVHAQ